MKNAFWLFLFTSSAFAADRYYSCGRVAGIEEYVVEINLETEKAAFFNNDIWTVVPMHSMSAPHLYTFMGPGLYLWPLKIDFDKQELFISVIETENGHKVRMVAEDGCKAIKEEDLRSGI